MTVRRVTRPAQALLVLFAFCAFIPTASARSSYEEVVDQWSRLRASKSKLKLRHHWMPVLAGFREVASSEDPTVAPKALYMEAKLWEDLYSISRRRSDLVQSHRAAMTLADRFPTSSLADDALWRAAHQAAEVLGPPGRSDELLTRLLREHPTGDMAAEARARLGAKPVEESIRQSPEDALSRLSAHLAGRQGNDARTEVRRVRSWRGKSSRRVVLELSQPVEYQVRKVTDRLFEVRMESLFEPDDVRAALAAHKVDATVVHLGRSLVLRFKENERKLKAVETFVLEDPFRLILEIGYQAESAVVSVPVPERSSEKKPLPMRKPPQKDRPVVVIDPGHGGKDGGARGHGGLLEKELTLKVAINLERELKKLGMDVILTRRDDSFVSLEDRTALANQQNAALFVSIHLNAHDSKDASGVETYFLDTTDDKYALRLAATENKTSTERVSEIQLAMVGLSMRFHTEESQSIASQLQESMVSVAQRYRKGGVRDLGVKSSLFYVLLGARMPAVLAELGFITNPSDAELLGQRWYRRKLAVSMAAAIREAVF